MQTNKSAVKLVLDLYSLLSSLCIKLCPLALKVLCALSTSFFICFQTNLFFKEKQANNPPHHNHHSNHLHKNQAPTPATTTWTTFTSLCGKLTLRGPRVAAGTTGLSEATGCQHTVLCVWLMVQRPGGCFLVTHGGGALSSPIAWGVSPRGVASAVVVTRGGLQARYGGRINNCLLKPWSNGWWKENRKDLH